MNNILCLANEVSVAIASPLPPIMRVQQLPSRGKALPLSWPRLTPLSKANSAAGLTFAGTPP